jgi:D-alanyl-D-alanine carboxypeptidase/D-alanyl-D-alanine-endopeptidase (penicillin-binding protein 4)
LRAPARTAPPTPAGVAAAVRRAFGARELGSRVAVTVVAAETGRVLYSRRGRRPVIPASTMKLVTAVTALQTLGPGAVFTTRLVATTPATGGVVTGDLVLVGDGDSTLASPSAQPGYPAPATLATLARAARRAGIMRVTGRLLVDGSRYTGPTTAPGWKRTYVTEGSVAPVTAVVADSGRTRPDDPGSPRYNAPDLAAGRRLLDLLRKQGVTVAGGVRRGGAPRGGGTAIGTVSSPPLAALVERMLQRSDNQLAEALFRQAARKRGLPASFTGGARAARTVLADLDVPLDQVVIHDGSGLSRLDRLTTDALAHLVRRAVDNRRPALRPVLTGLPVAGFNGTLSDRYRRPPAVAAAGLVRAKTGSLENVSTLAGLVLTRSGHLLAFAASADQVPKQGGDAAADALDAAAAALAGCGCR